MYEGPALGTPAPEWCLAHENVRRHRRETAARPSTRGRANEALSNARMPSSERLVGWTAHHDIRGFTYAVSAFLLLRTPGGHENPRPGGNLFAEGSDAGRPRKLAPTMLHDGI
jgi:hypothetical protein